MGHRSDHGLRQRGALLKMSLFQEVQHRSLKIVCSWECCQLVGQKIF